jgi:hypothetical protein
MDFYSRTSSSIEQISLRCCHRRLSYKGCGGLGDVVAQCL